MINGLPPFYDTNRKMMYHRILTAPILKTPYMSPEVIIRVHVLIDQAYDIVCQLLQREPTKRLGYHSFDEIKSHPWFSDINWEALYKKEVIPPFRPNVKDEKSTEQIDPEFTNQVPTVTPTPVNVVLEVDPKAFNGFSYVQDGVH